MAAALLLPPLLLPLLLPLLRASLLGSELLLAATHAKVLGFNHYSIARVLCCVGAPYPEVYLSAQRYRYFVWDLASVQAAFWATDPGGLQRLLARSSSASSASGAVAASGDSHTSSRTRPGTKPAGNASCSATAARAPARSKERESLAAAAPATGDMLCCGCADASCHDNLSIGTPGWNKSGSGHSTNVTAVAAAGLCTAHPVAWHLHVHQPPVARGSGSSAWRSSAAVSSLLQQLWARLWQLRLRALAAAAAAGHAALHVFYIAAWNQPHARRVVSMSAVVSPRERLRRFPLGQVAWYCAGTAFDIGTHLLLAAALGRALLLPLPPGAPQHDQH